MPVPPACAGHSYLPGVASLGWKVDLPLAWLCKCGTAGTPGASYTRLPARPIWTDRQPDLCSSLPLAAACQGHSYCLGNFVTLFSDPTRSRENSQARYRCSYICSFAWNLHSPRSVSTVSSKRSRAVAAPTLAGVLSSSDAVSEVRADGLGDPDSQRSTLYFRRQRDRGCYGTERTVISMSA